MYKRILGLSLTCMPLIACNTDTEEGALVPIEQGIPSPNPTAPPIVVSPTPSNTQTPAPIIVVPTPSPQPTPITAVNFQCLNPGVSANISDDNIAENTIDNDPDTRWSAQSNDGSAWLQIDCGNEALLEGINIAFYNGDQRSSSFKLAGSIDGVNWTDLTSILASSGSTREPEFYAFNELSTLRFVRYLGYGYSSATGTGDWNSLTEVSLVELGSSTSTPSPVAVATPTPTPIAAPTPTPVATPTPTPVATPTPTPIETPTPLTGDSSLGETVYAAQCANCHGTTGVGGSASLNNDELTFDEMVNAIELTMPLLTPSSCSSIDNCAANTTAYIKEVLFANSEVIPGYVIARKLNQAEYDNTIRDLFGLESSYSPSTEYNFAQDGFRSGFNNNAAGLTTAPLDVENYLRASKGIVDKVFANSSAKARIFVCNTESDACLTDIINNILPKVYRRPITNEDRAFVLDTASGVASLGGNFEKQIQGILINALLMPDFLFRTERPPEGINDVRDLDAFEIASRLSYFLWASMPDDELFALAASGELTAKSTINAQVSRMLIDTKADALAEQFTQQWFQTLALSEVFRDGTTLDTQLQNDIETEVNLLVRDAVMGDISIQGLLNSSYTYLNKNLADHYGIDSSSLDDDFQRVDFESNNTERGGLLRMANFLMINAHPENNSPVRRGKWVLERLLCSPPPPPPANIPAFEPEDSETATGSLRTQTEAFFAADDKASCNACHEAMHGVGFPFEHYDPNGLWQTDDNGFEIDVSGVISTTGVTFNGVPGLIDAVIQDDRLASCVVEKTFAYALGRDLITSDYTVFNNFADELGEDFYLPALFQKVSTSPLMLQRSSEEAE